MITTDSLLLYLRLHKSLPIPGLGTVRIERLPARKDTASRQMNPPAFQYRWDAESDQPSPDFFPFLARQEQISEAAAMEAFQQWSAHFCNSLSDAPAISLGAVGTFRKDDGGETVFASSGPIPVFYNTVSAERVSSGIRLKGQLAGSEDEDGSLSELSVEQVRDNWYVYALMLFVLLMALLGYHYFQQGFQWDAFGLRNLPGV